MSIWSDQAVKALQEKVAWLEQELEQLKHANAELRGLVIPLDKPVNGTLQLKRK